jgi:hypothetical protein
VNEVVDARKHPIGPDRLWECLARAEQVLVAAGQNVHRYRPDRCDKAALLSRAAGRTGNLRSPALLIDGELLIGFNTALYKRFL